MSTLPAADVQPSSESAFAEMYERHADRIYAFCRRRLRSREEADDAVQETFVAAMRAIQRGSVPLCESAWLFKIAENVCFAAYRSGARRHARDLSDSERIERLPDRDRDGDTLIGLEGALDALPSSQRNALLLRELRGLSYKEIALQLGVSVPAVETLIYRARRGLVRGLENGAGLGRRATASLNLGSALAMLKGWFAGATAIKVASAATVVAIGSLAAGDALYEQQEQAETAGTRTPVAKRSVLRETPGTSRKPSTSGTRSTRRDSGRARPDAKRPTPASRTATRPRGRARAVDKPTATAPPPAAPAEPKGSAPEAPVSPTTAPVAAPQLPAPPSAPPPAAAPPEVPNVVGDPPDVQTPGVQVPGVQLPEVQVPGVQLPGVQVPPVQVPGVQVPGVQVPGVKVPDLPILP